MEQNYTISIFTENCLGLLNRVILVFTRRRINIKSISISETEIKGVYRYTIGITSACSQVENIVRQIEKIVEVYKAFYHTDDEIVAVINSVKKFSIYLKEINELTN